MRCQKLSQTLECAFNSTHYFIMKIPNKQELQQMVFNHSSDVEFKDFMNLYEKFTAKPYYFLVIDAKFLHVSERIF